MKLLYWPVDRFPDHALDDTGPYHTAKHWNLHSICRQYFIHPYQIYVALKTSKADKTGDQVSQKAKARVVALQWKDEENLSLLVFFFYVWHEIPTKYFCFLFFSFEL